MSNEVKRYWKAGVEDGGLYVASEDYDALLAEVERLRAMTAVTCGVGDGSGKLLVHGDYDSIKKVQSLVFELESLRKDAERYRWIRNPDQAIGHVIDKMVSPGIYEYRAGDELDDAIDDAMRQS